MAEHLTQPYLSVLRNEHFWPKHWQRQIRKIDRVVMASDMVYKYYVLPRSGDTWIEFSTPDEIDTWARITDRLTESTK